ncbi:peptidylprolyl isomerase [Cognatiluteimonas profundi]|uniref:peptidylprolyl isomerase n=1 Tax=Cognatiluteimonas profundi TaxID=2594501 RepID=UPI00131EC388|nr:peptidylprolyl isomerase [Lysobacter profundi]
MNKLFACLIVFTALLGGVLAPAQAQQSAPQPLDRIVAVVDADVILQSELDRAERNIRSQYANRQDQLPPSDVLRRQVLERLILVRLEVARAAEMGVRVSDEEVDAAVANIARQNKITPEQLQAQLAQQGQSSADFRNSLRDELTAQRLRQHFAQSRISVSDAEVDAALAAQASNGPQYHMANILIALPENATPEEIKTAQTKIDGIKALLDKGGIDFPAAAVRYSDSANALEGGDLGWRSLDEVPSAFSATLKDMQVGQVIGPTRGPSGFQLLKLIETRDASKAAPQMVTQYHARHILVRTGDNISDEQAKAKIDTLRARLTGGADFATVASDSSEDVNSAARGGDLGWFTPETFGPEFGSQVTALQDGQVSQPFKSEAGWHIVQRIGTRQADAGEENRRAQIRETIGQRKLEEEWTRYQRDMRNEAYVDIRLADKPSDGTTPPAGATGNDSASPAQPAPNSGG